MLIHAIAEVRQPVTLFALRTTTMLSLVNSTAPTSLATVSLPLTTSLATALPANLVEARHGAARALAYQVSVQHEMLKSLREQAPYAYVHANRELGLTLERTQALLEQRQQVVSAARALKLARLVAAEPNGREIFGATGHSLYGYLHQDLNRTLKGAVRTLPRGLRQRLAFAVARRIAYKFAGSTNHLILEPHAAGVYLTLRNSIFAERFETLSGAHTYYRNVFETLLQQFAHIDCEVTEIRRPRVHPNQCNFKIVWDA
jgi:hypothetical protein